MLQARYRRDYDGEFVVLTTRIVDGVKEQTRDWIPNLIENHHISNRAAIIGGRGDMELFDFRHLQRHRGGLLGKKRLQTYGSGDLWTDMRFDFFVTTDSEQIKLIAQKEYDKDATVYTNARFCVEQPGRFYLIPYGPALDNLATSIYVAAFDGHAEVFLLGYNKETLAQTSSWQQDVNAVMTAYQDTQFILVGVKSNMPDLWLRNTNVTHWPIRQFISHCDV